MPDYVRLPIKVTVTVEVDGHTLAFSHTEEASGGRGCDDLGHEICRLAELSCIRAQTQAINFVDKAWG